MNRHCWDRDETKEGRLDNLDSDLNRGWSGRLSRPTSDTPLSFWEGPACDSIKMHIETAMRRSVRRGVSDIFFDSLLGRRDVTTSISNVKSAFSSWDNCMKATYCKSVLPFFALRLC